MGIVERLATARLWDDWREKFTSDFREYITPCDDAVVEASKSLNVSKTSTDGVKAIAVWEFIDSSLDYELSKVWKSPSESLSSGVADCEDRVFLACSMLPNIGVDKFDIVIGMAGYGGRSGPHAWMEVNGKVVDPTTNRQTSRIVEYNEEDRFTVKVGK